MWPARAGRAAELEPAHDRPRRALVGDRRPHAERRERDRRRPEQLERAPAAGQQDGAAARAGRAAGRTQRRGERARRGARADCRRSRADGGVAAATIRARDATRTPLDFAPAIVLALGLYAGDLPVALARARREEGGRGAGWLQLLCFAVGAGGAAAAVVSPIDGLGEDYLFSAHMLQHILLGDIAPVFLLLALSRVIMRPATRRLHAVERALGRFAHPLTGLFLWFGLIYLWHIPALYDAAIESASCTPSSTPRSSPPASRSGGR